MKKTMGMMLAMVVVALVGSSAHAVFISNGSTTLFDAHGFELYDLGRLDSPWTSTNSAGCPVEVIDDASPGAAYGEQYLEVVRGSASTPTYTRVYFTTQTSGTVHAEFAVQTVDADSQIYMYNPAGDAGVWINFTSSEGVKVYNTSTGWTSTGLAWSTGSWFDVEVDYAPNASTADITVNGITATADVLATYGINSVKFQAGSGSSIYVDGVPEPATMSMLAIGGISMLIRRKRNS